MAVLQITPDLFSGVALVYFFLFLSTTSLLSVLCWVLFLALRRVISSEHRPTPREFVFFGSQLGYYAACLLIANMFNGIAGLMGIPWMLEKQISEGSLCSAQAAMQQFGNISNGYFTTAIAVHTFNSLVLRRRQSRAICLMFIAFGWILAAAVAIVPQLVFHPDDIGLYGISGLSCGVKATFPFFIFLFHLLPIFIASLVSALLYSLIFLSLRGTLQINGGVKLHLNPEHRYHQRGEDYQAFVAALARIMLWFPITYILLLVPYSVTRLFMSSERSVPFPVMVVAYCFWFLIGFVNVFIVYKTFRALEPAMDGKISSSQRDVEASTKMTHPFPPTPQASIPEKHWPATQDPAIRSAVMSHDRSLSQESNSSRSALLVASAIIATPASARLSDSFRSGTLSRQNSEGSNFSLSAAPRRTLSRGSSNTALKVSPAPREEEMDVAGWLNQYVEDTRNRAQQPMTLRLSAVTEYVPPGSARGSSRGSASMTHSPVGSISSLGSPRRIPRRL